MIASNDLELIGFLPVREEYRDNIQEWLEKVKDKKTAITRTKWKKMKVCIGFEEARETKHILARSQEGKVFPILIDKFLMNFEITNEIVEELLKLKKS
jgi:hypothetical protein